MLKFYLFLANIVVPFILPVAWYWKIAAFFGIFFSIALVRALFRVHAQGAMTDCNRREDEGITPALFRQVYLRLPEGNHQGSEVEKVVDLLVHAGIGVGKYNQPSRPPPPIFWRKAATAANELRMWLVQNSAATPQERLAYARKVVDTNRLVHRSLRG